MLAAQRSTIPLLSLLVLFGATGLAWAQSPTEPPPDDEALADLLEETDEGESEPVPASLDATSGLRVATICTNCNAATLTMNGLQGDHVRVTWEGIPVTGGLATVFALTQVPEDFIGYSRVNRGPGSVLTGDSGLGGSIDLHAVERDEERLFVRGEIGSEGWRQLLAGGTGRWGRVGGLLLAQGAGSDAWDSNSDSYNDSPEFDRATALGILDFHLTEQQTITLGGTWYDESQVDGPGPPVIRDTGSYYLHEDVDLLWRELSATWRLERPTGLGVAVSLRESRRDQAQRSPFEAGQPYQTTFDIEDQRSYASVSVETPVGVAGFLSAGLSHEEITLAVDQLFHAPRAPNFIEDSLRHRTAYIQWDQSVGARWDLTLGARFDEYHTFGESDGPRSGFEKAPEERSSFLSPRARVSYQPNEELVLSASHGRGTIGPRPVFEQTCCGARYQRSLDLEPERAWSTELRAEWRPRLNQRLVVTAFASEFENYHERIVFQSEAAIVYYKKAALPSARLRGFDLIHDMRFFEDRLTLGWTYTYTDSEVLEPFSLAGEQAAADWGCREGDRPTDPAAYPLVLDEAGSPLRYTPSHAGTLKLQWESRSRASKLGLTAAYTGSVRHFEIGTEGEPLLLDATSRLPCTPWGFLESSSFWTANLSYEQRLGRSDWTLHAAVDNVFDYVMPDLGEFDSAFDWGPLQGRFIRVGATWRP